MQLHILYEVESMGETLIDVRGIFSSEEKLRAFEAKLRVAEPDVDLGWGCFTLDAEEGF